MLYLICLHFICGIQKKCVGNNNQRILYNKIIISQSKEMSLIVRCITGNNRRIIFM